MTLVIERPDILLLQDSDEKLLQNYSCLIYIYIMLNVMYNDQGSHLSVFWN